MATYGITGGNGFIGGHITEELQRRGHNVIVFDHSQRTTPGELFLGDIRDRTAVIEFAAHVDGIIHLAAVLGTQETIGNASPAVETNMMGGINILEAARQYDLPLVYAGVGNYWMLNTYSSTKHAIERLLYQFKNEFNLPFATVRPVNAYGPRQRVAPPFGPGKVKKIMPAFVCRALTGQPLEVYGEGNQISDMVFVGDVANVFSETIEQLTKNQKPEHPIEVGPSQSITVLDVANNVIKVASSLTPFKSTITKLPMRPGEKNKSDVDSRLLSRIMEELPISDDALIIKRKLRELGTTVSADTSTLLQIGMDSADFVPFEVGCELTVNWFHENKGKTWEFKN
jgi:UDP-glucose 4-epimerase